MRAYKIRNQELKEETTRLCDLLIQRDNHITALKQRYYDLEEKYFSDQGVLRYKKIIYLVTILEGLEVEKNVTKEANRKIKEAYLNAFRIRYGVEPNVQSAQFNSQVSSLRKKLGTENSIAVVNFYLSHNDGYYLKNTHSFGLCLKDADTLFVQMQKGKAITSADVRRFEKSVQVQQTLREAKEGNF